MFLLLTLAGCLWQLNWVSVILGEDHYNLFTGGEAYTIKKPVINYEDLPSGRIIITSSSPEPNNLLAMEVIMIEPPDRFVTNKA